MAQYKKEYMKQLEQVRMDSDNDQVHKKIVFIGRNIQDTSMDDLIVQKYLFKRK